MARIGHESSTTRGGGWDDFWYTLRGFVSKPFRRKTTDSRQQTTVSTPKALLSDVYGLSSGGGTGEQG
jgi:hypothetical protein